MESIMKNIFKHIVYIIEGYSVWLYDNISGRANERAKKRLIICKECQYNKNRICELCGCILKAKTRVNFPLDENNKSIGGCPIKKW